MTVRPLQPSTSKAVQTVIAPTQGFVNQFSQFYERPPPKKVTQTIRRNPGEPKMAAPQRKPVARSTTHSVAFANKPRIVRGKSDSPKPESTVEQFMRLSEQPWQNSEAPRSADIGTMSTAQEMAETVKSVHLQSVSVTNLNSVQASTPRNPEPRVGPTPIIIPHETSWHRWNQKTSTPRRSQPRRC